MQLRCSIVLMMASALSGFDASACRSSAHAILRPMRAYLPIHELSSTLTCSVGSRAGKAAWAGLVRGARLNEISSGRMARSSGAWATAIAGPCPSSSTSSAGLRGAADATGGDEPAALPGLPSAPSMTAGTGARARGRSMNTSDTLASSFPPFPGALSATWRSRSSKASCAAVARKSADSRSTRGDIDRSLREGIQGDSTSYPR